MTIMHSGLKSFELSKNICNHVIIGDTTSEDYRCNIRNLLEICNGPSKKSEVGFCKILNSEELILAILRIKKCIEYLNDDPELSVAVIRTLLQFSRIPWDIIYFLTKSILLSSFENKEELTTVLWDNKGKSGFPSKIYSLLVKHDSKLLENYIYNIYHNYSDLSKDVWKDKEHRFLINWCSESPEGFQISTYILNQFLVHSKFKNFLLKIIKDFICNVMDLSRKISRDFVLLYPVEYQSLASLLVLEPSFSPLKIESEKRLAMLEKSNPSMALLFYSHFPKWIEL